MSAPDFEKMARELWQSGALTDTAGPLGAVTAVQSLAAALRAAAEEEREAIRQHILDRLNRVSKHSCPQYESCIYCEAARELDSMEDDIRARGEVGK